LHHLRLARYRREYYYQIVNKRTRNFLNWILIAMLAMLPLRSVMALEKASCEMHAQDTQLMQDHAMHMMHSMVDHMQMDISVEEDCCCCDSAMSCSNDCGAGLNVSLITQPAVALPEINKPVYRAQVNHRLVYTDLSPPVRPPAHRQI
jgi:hypothetical protein